MSTNLITLPTTRTAHIEEGWEWQKYLSEISDQFPSLPLRLCQEKAAVVGQALRYQLEKSDVEAAEDWLGVILALGQQCHQSLHVGSGLLLERQ